MTKNIKLDIPEKLEAQTIPVLRLLKEKLWFALASVADSPSTIDMEKLFTALGAMTRQMRLNLGANKL